MRVKLWLIEVQPGEIPEQVTLVWKSPDRRYELVTGPLSRTDPLVEGLVVSAQEAITVDIERVGQPWERLASKEQK